MRTSYSGLKKNERLKVQIDENIYSGDEVVAYFDDILKILNKKPRSLKTRVQFVKVTKILIQKKEYRKALGVVYQALSLYNNEPAITKLIVEIFIKLKNLEGANKVLQEYLGKYPGDAAFKFMLATIRGLEGDSKGEEQALLNVIITPRYDYFTNKMRNSAYRRLGDIYMKTERFEQASGVAEELIKRTSDESVWSMYFTTLLKLGKREKLREVKNRFARLKRARVYFDKGSEYEMQHKYNIAIRNYRDGLGIYPDDVDTTVKMGNIFMFRKKWYSKAEKFFRKAVNSDPDQANYRTSLIICLRKQGKYEEAFEHAREVMLLEPESNVYIFYCLAERLHREDEFFEVAQEILKDDTVDSYPTLYFELGVYHKKNGNLKESTKWLNKSLRAYKKMTRNFPEDWELFLGLGDCCNMMKLYDEAENAYKQAECIEGSDLSDIYERLVDINQKAGNPDKSTYYLKQLVRMHPTSIVNYIDLGINFLSGLTSKIRGKELD